MNASEIRQAVRELKATYGMDVRGNWFRFTQFQLTKGYYKGRDINSGKWIVIYRWEVR
jgi:hypothetical protein